MKVLFRNIHLYLGLAAGLVIAVVCFTGAMLEFEKEMQSFIYSERYTVTVGGERVPIGQMIGGLKKIVPTAKINSVKLYSDPARSVEISYSEGRGGGEARAGAAGPGADPKGAAAPQGRPQGAPAENKQAYMNPYTGALIGLHSMRSPFFATMFTLHRWLLMGDTGKLIVGSSTLLFLFILATGIVLWWPKNKRILRQHLKLKLNGGWKRINHDLHIVLGFYTAIFLFAFAFTGLAWSFKWFNDGIYWATGSKSEQPKPPLSAMREGASPISIDQAYTAALKAAPGAEYYTVSAPRDSSASYRVTMMPSGAAHERATDQLYVDQYSGGTLASIRFGDQSLGQQVRTTFYPIHVGSIGGLPGRIIAFICCLLGATFPISGIILWINRLMTNRRIRRAKRGAASRRQVEVAEGGMLVEETVAE